MTNYHEQTKGEHETQDDSTENDVSPVGRRRGRERRDQRLRLCPSSINIVIMKSVKKTWKISKAFIIRIIPTPP